MSYDRGNVLMVIQVLSLRKDIKIDGRENICSNFSYGGIVFIEELIGGCLVITVLLLYLYHSEEDFGQH